VTYALSNGFASCDDAAALQDICARLGPGHIQVFAEHWSAWLTGFRFARSTMRSANPLQLGASDGDFHDLADALQADGTLPQLDGGTS
jgi:hypothetical protein